MTTEALAHTIADATKISGIGQTTLYELIGAGKIEARKAGIGWVVVAPAAMTKCEWLARYGRAD
jgi:hypothetical protein